MPPVLHIAAPSFLIPADRITNVRKLAGAIGEVELLYMCSLRPEDAPDKEEIRLLAELPMRYNVHMPYDRDLSQVAEWTVIESFAEAMRPLNAVTHTFHMQKEKSFFTNLEVFTKKTELPVTLENSGDDTHLFDTEFSAGICADLGHIIHHGRDVEQFLGKYGHKTELLHLHGSDGKHDHMSISHTDKGILRTIKGFAAEKQITICLEVFNFAGFMESREILLSL
jgi:sugar phosphate isomerase/epimerase